MGTVLAKLPLWLSIIIVFLLTGGLAALIHAIIRRIYRHETLRDNNEVAGFNYAVLGVVYSVLLAFMTMAVYEEYKDGKKSIRMEAGSIVMLHQMAGGLSEPAKSGVREELVRYARSVVDDEWPLLGRGRESVRSRSILKKVFQVYIDHTPGGEKEGAIYAQSLEMLDDMHATRNQRITNSHTVIPGFMWFVLVIGAVITISFTFFFGAPNLKAQVLMTFMLSILIILILLLIVHLDNPFLGPVSVSAEPFHRAIEEMRVR